MGANKIPKPPRPGQAVYVQFNEPHGECGGCVTRVVGYDVYVCYEGEAHEYEEPLDWKDPAVRGIVKVKRQPPPVTAQRPRQDRRSRAEKATGWGGPSRRRRRRPAAPEQTQTQTEEEDQAVEPVPDGSQPTSGGIPFVRTPSGRLVASSPGRTEQMSLHRTASHQLLEHSHETLVSQEQQLEAEARRLEMELERELSGSIEALSLDSTENAEGAAAKEAASCVTIIERKDGSDTSMQHQKSCGVLAVNRACIASPSSSPPPETIDYTDEYDLDRVDWKAECYRLQQRERDHLQQIRQKDRQIKMLQTMLSAAAGLDRAGDSDDQCRAGLLALTG